MTCTGRYNSRSATAKESGRRLRGRRKSKGSEDDTKPPVSPYFTKNRFRSALVAVNLHNNRAGRRVSENVKSYFVLAISALIRIRVASNTESQLIKN